MKHHCKRNYFIVSIHREIHPKQVWQLVWERQHYYFRSMDFITWSLFTVHMLSKSTSLFFRNSIPLLPLPLSLLLLSLEEFWWSELLTQRFFLNDSCHFFLLISRTPLLVFILFLDSWNWNIICSRSICWLSELYHYLSLTLDGLQGSLVSILFCFGNNEVCVCIHLFFLLPVYSNSILYRVLFDTMFFFLLFTIESRFSHLLNKVKCIFSSLFFSSFSLFVLFYSWIFAYYRYENSWREVYSRSAIQVYTWPKWYQILLLVTHLLSLIFPMLLVRMLGTRIISLTIIAVFDLEPKSDPKVT